MMLTSGSLDGIAQFITVLILFIFVLLLTYGTTRWIAGYQKGKTTSGNMEVIETYTITTGKYLQIVRAADKVLLIAVCKDSITMLTELTPESIKKQDSSQTAVPDFKSVLEKFGKKTSK